jgi:hypothetical protein
MSTCLKWTRCTFTSLVNSLQRLLKKLVWIRVVRIHGCMFTETALQLKDGVVDVTNVVMKMAYNGDTICRTL